MKRTGKTKTYVQDVAARCSARTGTTDPSYSRTDVPHVVVFVLRETPRRDAKVAADPGHV